MSTMSYQEARAVTEAVEKTRRALDEVLAALPECGARMSNPGYRPDMFCTKRLGHYSDCGASDGHHYFEQDLTSGDDSQDPRGAR